MTSNCWPHLVIPANNFFFFGVNILHRNIDLCYHHTYFHIRRCLWRCQCNLTPKRTDLVSKIGLDFLKPHRLLLLLLVLRSQVLNWIVAVRIGIGGLVGIGIAVVVAAHIQNICQIISQKFYKIEFSSLNWAKTMCIVDGSSECAKKGCTKKTKIFKDWMEEKTLIDKRLNTKHTYFGIGVFWCWIWCGVFVLFVLWGIVLFVLYVRNPVYREYGLFV